MNVLKRIDPTKLKNHPLNAKLYGDVADDDFVASIKKEGVLTPLTVTAKNVIISGHRRKQAAVIADLKEVPCIVRDDLTDPLDIKEAVIEANRQREKTAEQRAREFSMLEEIEAERAKKRLKTSTGGSKPRPTQNSAEAGKGESRKKAAKAVGMSHDTAKKAVTVVEAIDEAEAAGDIEVAAELRATLNEQSVAAAHRKVAPQKKPKSQTAAAKASAKPATRHQIAKPLMSAIGAAARELDKFNKVGNTNLIVVRLSLRTAIDAVVAWRDEK